MSDWTPSVDATEIAQVTTTVEIHPVNLGDWLAEQGSDYQAEALMAFATKLQTAGALEWRMQCAYVRDDVRRDKTFGPTALREVLRELIEDD